MNDTNRLLHIITIALAAIFLAGGWVGSPSVQADLVAQYHFDEAGGTTAFDSVGSVHGTLSVAGAAFSAGGIAGNAISLDRVAGGFVNMGPSFGFLTGDYSIAFWVKTTTTQIDTLALSKHTANSANGYYFNINPTGDGGTANKVTFDASSQTSQGVTSTTSVNDGVWHQIVGVYQAGGSESIFVDGAPAESTNGSFAMIANSAPFLIGGVNSAGTPTARYTGLVDEVQIYNQALTGAQVDYLFQNPAQGIPEPGTASLIAVGVAGWLTLRRRSRNA
jgi:Concanavalin A-like lectin/glucanases superfamily